jgi:arylsulfatase A-like enzyme
MTGQPAYAHGLTENGPTRGVIDQKRSLPGVLGRLGYQTAAIGKMHFGPQRMRHGFQEMILPDDYYREMAKKGSECQPMRHGIGQNELYPALATVPEAKTLTAWTAEQCVDYIRYRRDPEMPFFLWCSFSKPHPPLDPPEPYFSMYLGSAIPDPVISDWSTSENCPIAIQRFIERRGFDTMHPEVIRAARAAYYGLITQIDYNMGRILAALQESRILKDTLIIYTSDHGEYLGDHRCCAKTFFHEPSARVPFVLRLPQQEQGTLVNRVDDRLVSLADIYPTLVRAAGGDLAESAHGLDLIGILEGSVTPRQVIVSLSGPSSRSEQISITDGRWKYLYYPEGPTEQLFDLAADPLEQTELCRKHRATHADTINRLRHLILEELRKNGAAYLAHDELPEYPRMDDNLDERRSRDFPGFSTEYKDVDTRH